jgi:hypothetical protein
VKTLRQRLNRFVGLFFFQKPERQFGLMDSLILPDNLGEAPSPKLGGTFISELFNQFVQPGFFGRGGSASWQVNGSLFVWHQKVSHA